MGIVFVSYIFPLLLFGLIALTFRSEWQLGKEDAKFTRLFSLPEFSTVLESVAYDAVSSALEWLHIIKGQHDIPTHTPNSSNKSRYSLQRADGIHI